MRYLLALLMIIAAVLIMLRPEYFKEIVSTLLVVGGIMVLVPDGQPTAKK